MRKEEREEGIKEGIKEGTINIVKTMLSDGTLTIEKIAEYSGLSINEIKKLETN